MLYGLIAEDGAIEKSIPVLLSRLVDLEGEPVECRRLNGKPDFIANFWKHVKEFQFRYPGIHKVLAVCDADGDSATTLTAELNAKVAARLGHLPFPLFFHVITRQLETWWVAESAAISTVTGVAIPSPRGNAEENLEDPRRYIIQRVAAAKKVYTPTDAEATARIVQLPTLRGRCPGFVEFEQKTQNGHDNP